MSEPMTETKVIFARIPTALYKAARIKGIRLDKTINAIVSEKLAEWVSEPDYSTDPMTATTKTKRAKVTTA